MEVLADLDNLEALELPISAAVEEAGDKVVPVVPVSSSSLIHHKIPL
jgi:hypothetical protein